MNNKPYKIASLNICSGLINNNLQDFEQHCNSLFTFLKKKLTDKNNKL